MRHTMPSSLRNRVLTAPLLGLLLTLAACGSGSGEAEGLKAAREQLARGDVPAAIIEVKNVLERNPESGAGRLLLGKALVAQGDAAAAQIELRKALDGKVPEAEVLPDMVRALLLAGEAARVVGEYGNTQLPDAQAQAELKTLVATALLSTARPDEARSTLDEALKAKPDHAGALVLKARITAAAGQFDDALKQLGAVLATTPGHEGAGLLKAQVLLHGKRDADGALAAYRDVVKAQPRSAAARTELAQLLLERQLVAEARAELAELQKFAARRPETLLLQAQLALAEKNHDQVRELTDKLLALSPNHVPTLMLAASSAFQAGQFAQAQALLARVLKADPQHGVARLALAQVQLRSAQPDQAIETLKPLSEQAQADATVLNTLGEAYLRVGDVKRSEATYQRALKAAPQDARGQTGLALAQLARGEAGAAMAGLEATAQRDASAVADLALVAARLSQNDAKGALAAIDRLQRKQPDQALPLVLRGRLLGAQKDLVGAAAAFEQALAKDAKLFAAVEGLAMLDAQAKRFDVARKRLTDFAAANPRDGRPRLALAALERTTGAPDARQLEALREAVKAEPTLVAAQVTLVRHLTGSGDVQGALTAAQDASAALPADPSVMDLLGTAQLTAGDAQRAVSTFKRLVAQQPRQVLPLLRLADAQRAAKDRAAAAQALRQALELEPDNLQALRGQALMALEDQKQPEAVALARKVQARAPKDAAGWALEGELEERAGHAAAALSAYRAAQQRVATSERAARIVALLHRDGKAAEAEKATADWLKDHPKDALFLYQMGDLATGRQDWSGAEARYRQVLDLAPQHAAALNNIAWLLVKQGKPGGAAMAEKALALMPDRAPMLDTLSLALEAERQLDKAVQVQKRATELEPRNGDYRLRLAQLLVKKGDKSGAREELQALSQLGDRYPKQAEVAALLKTL